MGLRISPIKNSKIDRAFYKNRYVGAVKRSRIDNENTRDRNGKREEKLGPRATFLKKYKSTGDFNSAKQELRDQGYRPEFYGDKALENWIKEGGKEVGGR